LKAFHLGKQPPHSGGVPIPVSRSGKPGKVNQLPIKKKAAAVYQVCKVYSFTMMDFLKRIWGVGAPKGFKAAAWVAAFGIFGLMQYRDQQKAKRAIEDKKQ
jgi:hypothetical protein